MRVNEELHGEHFAKVYHIPVLMIFLNVFVSCHEGVHIKCSILPVSDTETIIDYLYRLKALLDL